MPKFIVLFLLANSILLTAGCSTQPQGAFAEFDSLDPQVAPAAMVGTWTGSYADGKLSLVIKTDGAVITCIDTPGYFFQGAGKYRDQVVHFEDNSSTQVKVVSDGLAIMAPQEETELATLSADPLHEHGGSRCQLPGLVSHGAFDRRTFYSHTGVH